MVKGFLDLLEERYAPQLDDKAREYISYAVDGASRMTALIRGLLAYSRIDHEPGSPEPTDAGAALAAALSNLVSSIEEAGARVMESLVRACVVGPPRGARLPGPVIYLRRSVSPTRRLPR